MNITAINTAILQGGFTNEQLTSVLDAVKYAKSQLSNQNIRALRVGDSVKFTNTRTGEVLTGHITKISIKNLNVKTMEGNWRVPANMVTPAEDTVAV
jgi:hypothetical protein